MYTLTGVVGRDDTIRDAIGDAVGDAVGGGDDICGIQVSASRVCVCIGCSQLIRWVKWERSGVLSIANYQE